VWVAITRARVLNSLHLGSLGGCAGMDVIIILTIVRVKPDYFNVEVSDEFTDERPKYYHTI